MRSASPLGLRALPSQRDRGLRGVDAVHPLHAAKTDQKPHPGPRAAAQVDAVAARLDAGLFGQVHRRGKPADVDLLAHDQFPQPALRTVVNRLDVGKRGVRDFVHGVTPARKRVGAPPTEQPPAGDGERKARGAGRIRQCEQSSSTAARPRRAGVVDRPIVRLPDIAARSATWPERDRARSPADTRR